jgi:hypothetical protein
MVYGDDAVSRQPREPLVVDADSEQAARDRAVAGGMAVRAVIAEPVAEPSPIGTPAEDPANESAEVQGLRRFVLLVVVPLALAFFLVLAAVRTLFEAAVWTMVWSLGALLGGGLAGLLWWASREAVPVEVAWPLGLAVGLMALSAMHGSQVGWRWWWSKRALGPLAQALWFNPQQAAGDDPSDLRWPVLLAQGLAGAILGLLAALAGWATDWGWPTIFACTLGGGIGLGVEGAVLGAVLARRRPLPPPGVAPGPSIASLAGLLTRLWGHERLGRSLVVGYAIDRAAPGVVAGTLVGVVVFLLGWSVVG